MIDMTENKSSVNNLYSESFYAITRFIQLENEIPVKIRGYMEGKLISFSYFGLRFFTKIHLAMTKVSAV